MNLVLGLAVAAVPLWFVLDGPPPTWLLFVVAGSYGFLKMANWAVVQTLAGLAFLGLAAATSFPAAATTLALAGLLASPLTIWAQTIRMRLTPEEMRGRVFGVLRTLMQSTPPIGGALAGVLLGGPTVAVPVLVMSGMMAVPGLVGLATPGLTHDGGPRVPQDDLPVPSG